MAGHRAPLLYDFMNNVSNTNNCIKYFQEQDLLAKEMECKKCLQPMKLTKKPNKVCKDGQAWNCSKCNTCKTIRQGSFFKVCTKKHMYDCALICLNVQINYSMP